MMTHIRLHLSYPPTQLFDLVADVERYPEFLPWVLATRISHRKDRTIWVDMTIEANFLRKRFTTVALLERPHRISINSHDSLFEYFQQIWKFEPATEGGTNVGYEVDFRFQSRLLQVLIGGMFAERATEMVAAFRHRAQQLLGPASSEKSR
jgi:coenzyme Q-binding protein COQ10